MVSLQSCGYVPGKCLMSVLGPHAGESVDDIFSRKVADVNSVGLTYWLFKSSKANPLVVRKFLGTIAKHRFCLMLGPASKGGSRATSTSQVASEWSADNDVWSRLPGGLSDVTGKLPAFALVIDKFFIEDISDVNLAEFVELSSGLMPRPMMGASTLCIEHVNELTPIKKYRRVVAVARLVSPYCVFVR